MNSAARSEAARSTQAAADVKLASHRVERTLFITLGIGGSVFFSLALETALAQLPLLRGMWGMPTFVALSALCASISVVAVVATGRATRILTSVFIVCFSVALIAWLPAQSVAELPSTNAPWLLSVIAVPTTAAAMAWPASWAWPYLIACCGYGGILRDVADDRVPTILAIEEFSYMLLMSTVLASLVWLVRRAARRQDIAAEAANQEASRAASSEARTQQRRRFDALMHDDVMSTLIVAARADETMRPQIALFARRALRRMDMITRPAAIEADVSPVECGARLRTAASRPGFPALQLTILDDQPIPAAVAAAIAEACGEAVRNSMRHAAPNGEAVTRRAEATIDRSGVHVIISDTGTGFQPQRVASTRMGIRVSIDRRMQAIGGSATIHSVRHQGTTVTLDWRANEVPGER